MNRIKNFLAIAAFSLLILGIPALASAQSRDRDRDRDDDRYNNGGNNGGYNNGSNNGGYNNGTYGNGGYNNGTYGNGGYNNGQYGQYGNYGDMRSTVRDIKNRARDLQRQIDRELDHSRYNGSNREDQINSLAKDFKRATDDLDNNGRQNSNEIRRVVDLGSQLDRQISRSGLSYNVKNQMQAIRNDLQQLGYGSGYNNNNGNNRNNRNGSWGNGNTGWGNGNNKPSWWPF